MSVFLTDMIVRLPSAELTDIRGSEDEISTLLTNQSQVTATDASFSTPHSRVTREALIADEGCGGRTILVLTENTKQLTKI